MLKTLLNLPMGVSRCASGKRFPCLSRFSFMVLNLITLKGLACLPGRVWVKKGRPELAMLRSKVMSKNSGNSISRDRRLMRKSREGLKILEYILV